MRGPRLADADPWAGLRAATGARIGLGRCGDTMPLAEVLRFQLAHAAARDAVHAALDVPALVRALGCPPDGAISVRSAAPDRGTYLRRPDLGRRLDPACAGALQPSPDGRAYEAVFVIADGLSATAVQNHAAGVIAACLPLLEGWHLAPPVIATGARVALGDEVGARLGAQLCAVLIGERPGLSVSDSLGIYLTWDPRPGRLDSERNCISNIHRQGGLAYGAAAAKLAWLMRQARHRRLTGVQLKDELVLTGDGAPAQVEGASRV